MGKIDELIQQYCPDGVEYKHLGDICAIKGRIGFRGYTRNDQVKEGEGALSLSPINIKDGRMDYKKGTYITWEKYEESPEIMTYNGDIIFCKTASVGKTALVKDLPYKATINPQLVVLKDIQCNAPFLAYVLEADTIQNKVVSLAGVGSVPNISQKALSDLEIPLPPLPVQEAIVNILDRFAVYTAELQAELQARQQQYNYYRDTLLSFEGRDDVQWKKLGEVCKVLRGKRLTKSQLSSDGMYKVFHGGIEPIGFFDQSNREGDTTMVINVGASAGTVGFSKEAFWSSDGCFCLSHTPILSGRFLYYYLQTKEPILMSRVRKAGIPTLDGKVLEDIPIPIIPIIEQERIISILNRFDTLVNDLSQGLPAEIEARQQQYEYYRDQLLTFKRKEA